MKKIFLFALITIASSGCNKTNDRPYSYWYVNGKKFSNNDMEVTAQTGGVAYGSNSSIFGYGFYITYNLSDGPIKLDCYTMSNNYTCASIYYNDIEYLPPNNNVPYYLIKKTIDKQYSQYTLDSVWLYNSNNANDSVFVHGVFIEPNM